MRKKAIIGFLLLIFVFFGGGIYISLVNTRIITGMAQINALNQVEFFRHDLLHKLDIVQMDLLLHDSPHVIQVNDFVNHGKAITVAMKSCSNCHHSLQMMTEFKLLHGRIDNYLKQASLGYTLSANHQRMLFERKRAHALGQQLLQEIGDLAGVSSHKISNKIATIKAEITSMKNTLLALVILIPCLLLSLIYLFLDRFVSSVAVLIAAASKIRESGGGYQIGQKLPDEFGDLAEAFNQMSAGIRKRCDETISARNRYQTLFESADEAIFILEAKGEQVGKIVSANQAAALMHGYSLEELFAMRIQDLDTPESAAKAKDHIRDLLNGGRLEILVEHRHKTGRIFPVEVKASLIEIEGRRYFLAFDRDISLRVQTETALQRARQLAMVGEMAAGLAHEIKNPLAGIKASLEVLGHELQLEADDRDTLKMTIVEVERIEALLRNLLNYARPPNPFFALIDLNRLLENAVRNAGILLKARETSDSAPVEFIRDFDLELPMIMADAAQLQQVILNLLLNAIDAVSGGGKITLRSRPSPDGGVEIVVHDTGKGLSEAAVSGFFNRFIPPSPKATGLACRSASG